MQLCEVVVMQMLLSLSLQLVTPHSAGGLPVDWPALAVPKNQHHNNFDLLHNLDSNITSHNLLPK